MPEPVTRVPLCTATDCPRPSDPDWHFCLHCRSDKIEHHHTKFRSQGGRGRKEMVVPVCHDVHQGVHDRKLRDSIVNGVYILTTAAGELLGQWDIETGSGVTTPQNGAERAVAPAEPASLSILPTVAPSKATVARAAPTEHLGFDFRGFIAQVGEHSDSECADNWGSAQGVAEHAFLVQCAIATRFRDLYLGDDWAERAATLVREQTGRPCSAAQMFDRAAMCIALLLVDDPVEAISVWGLTVTRAIGRAADPEKAAEYAYAARDAGERMTDVAREIEGKATKVYACPDCGAVHPRSEFKEVGDGNI